MDPLPRQTLKQSQERNQTMMEENVVSAAGCTFAVPISEMERLITDAGYTPARRNTRYERV
jgi:cyclic dehypoxanthinyl futalosine synthase